MSGPFDNKGQGASGVFPNLSDRLDKSGTPGPIECACHPRADIERNARLQDALDALRAAVLWLHGEYRERPRTEFNAQAWHHKARSGIVGLRAILDAVATDTPEEPER